MSKLQRSGAMATHFLTHELNDHLQSGQIDRTFVFKGFCVQVATLAMIYMKFRHRKNDDFRYVYDFVNTYLFYIVDESLRGCNSDPMILVTILSHDEKDCILQKSKMIIDFLLGEFLHYDLFGDRMQVGRFLVRKGHELLEKTKLEKYIECKKMHWRSASRCISQQLNDRQFIYE